MIVYNTPFIVAYLVMQLISGFIVVRKYIQNGYITVEDIGIVLLLAIPIINLAVGISVAIATIIEFFTENRNDIIFGTKKDNTHEKQ